MNTFENIMENGAFAPKSKCSIFHNIFKYMIFQRRQKALLWSKGLNECNKSVIAHINSHHRILSYDLCKSSQELLIRIHYNFAEMVAR